MGLIDWAGDAANWASDAADWAAEQVDNVTDWADERFEDAVEWLGENTGNQFLADTHAGNKFSKDYTGGRVEETGKHAGVEDWPSWSHEEIYTMARDTMQPAHIQNNVDRWFKLAESLPVIIDSGNDNLRQKVGEGWQGASADAALAALHPIEQWAHQVSGQFKATQQNLEQSCNATTEAKKHIPEPIQLNWQEALGSIGIKLIGVHTFGQLDARTQRELYKLAHQYAVEVIQEAYATPLSTDRNEVEAQQYRHVKDVVAGGPGGAGTPPFAPGGGGGFGGGGGYGGAGGGGSFQVPEGPSYDPPGVGGGGGQAPDVEVPEYPNPGGPDDPGPPGVAPIPGPPGYDEPVGPTPMPHPITDPGYGGPGYDPPGVDDTGDDPVTTPGQGVVPGGGGYTVPGSPGYGAAGSYGGVGSYGGTGSYTGTGSYSSGASGAAVAGFGPRGSGSTSSGSYGAGSGRSGYGRGYMPMGMGAGAGRNGGDEEHQRKYLIEEEESALVGKLPPTLPAGGVIGDDPDDQDG